jgi:hypothetical protein
LPFVSLVKGQGREGGRADWGGGEVCTNYRVPTTLVVRLYHYLSIVQTVLWPGPRHSATESRSFRFTVKICSRSAIAVDTNPPSAAPLLYSVHNLRASNTHCISFSTEINNISQEVKFH